MMGNLYMTVGIPGIGKSTFVRNVIKQEDLYVSRDSIRFGMLLPSDEYFDREEEVFDEFVFSIQKGLIAEKNVYADATHLNPRSRRKLLYHITPDYYDNLYAIYFKGTIDVALSQNENRRGTRAYVPMGVIRRMASQLQEPTLEEGFNKIFIVEGKKITIISGEK